MRAAVHWSASAVNLPPAYRFGPFRFDAAAYQLLAGDRTVSLSPKVMDLLRLLASRPSQLVTKEDILRELWPDVAVTDNAVTQVVSELRQALGDDPASPRYVQTVPRRGYRFIASVQVSTPAAAPVRAPAERRPSGPAKRVIAVSDFRNVTADANDDWMAAGIAETVTNDLRSLRDLRVIDRASVCGRVAPRVDRSGPRVRARSAGGRQLSALGGSAAHYGARHRRAQRRSGGAFEGGRSGADVFQLQDAIVTQLLRSLHVTVTEAAAARIGVHETSSLEAYRALTEGRLKLETLNPADVPEAIRDFERAIALDARYAHAYVGLAHAHLWLYQASRARSRRTPRNCGRRSPTDVVPWSSIPGSAKRMRRWRSCWRRRGVSKRRSRRDVPRSRWSRTNGAIASVSASPPGAANGWPASTTSCTCFRSSRTPISARRWSMSPGRIWAVPKRSCVRGSRCSSANQQGRSFSANGLHWLIGLIRLAAGDIERAHAEFDRELTSRGSQMYSRGIRDGYVRRPWLRLPGFGGCRWRRGDVRKGAGNLPGSCRSLVGLADACRRRGDRRASEEAIEHAWRAIQELKESGRTSEAAMATSFGQILTDRADAAAATLMQLLEDAPPGFAGWTIPIEPLLGGLQALPAYRNILRRLAERAA